MPPRDKSTTTTPYKVIAFKTATATPTILPYSDPIVALTMAVEYLKAGYQVRLSDGCVTWFAHLPEPDPAMAEAAAANGQAAALTGPPRIDAKRGR